MMGFIMPEMVALSVAFWALFEMQIIDLQFIDKNLRPILWSRQAKDFKKQYRYISWSS